MTLYEDLGDSDSKTCNGWKWNDPEGFSTMALLQLCEIYRGAYRVCWRGEGTSSLKMSVVGFE